MSRVLAVVLLVALSVGVGLPTATPVASQGTTPVDTGPCQGPVEQAAAGETLVTTRGFRPAGDTITKRPAFLVALDRRGRPVQARNLTNRGRFAGRAVASTPNGTLLVTREGTHAVVEVLDQDFRPVSATRFGVAGGPRADLEAHDALLEHEGLLVAADDRLVRYDVAADRVVRTWPLPAEAFVDPESRVTAVAPAERGYLVTVAGNGTGSLLAVRDDGVAWRVDGLAEPAAVQALGDTALVAEAAGDRVLEVTPSGDVVWALTGLDRPQAAQRLPDGGTLVADGGTHRVMTVSPRGRVTWTAYVPWEPADASRTVTGDSPTAASLGVAGRHAVDGPTATYAQLGACETALEALGTNRSERARTVAADGAPLGLVGALVLGTAALALAAKRRT